MKKMYEFDRSGKKVFINDDDERKDFMKSKKYVTMFDDGKAMSFCTEDCNVYCLPIPLRPANNGMAFQKNSAYRVVFSNAQVFYATKRTPSFAMSL